MSDFCPYIDSPHNYPVKKFIEIVKLSLLIVKLCFLTEATLRLKHEMSFGLPQLMCALINVYM